VPLEPKPKEKNKQMGQETSKNKGSEEGKEKDEGWLKMTTPVPYRAKLDTGGRRGTKRSQ
jgi:hypothetical protein